MNRKILKLVIAILSLAVISVAIYTYAANQKSHVNIHTFIIKQQQMLLQKQQIVKERIQANDALIIKVKSQIAPETPVTKAKPKAGPVSTCDCYDASSPYNYPNNFKYGLTGEREYRLKPYCKCLSRVEAPTVIAPFQSPTTPPSGGNSGTNSNTDGYDWGIKY